MSDYEDSVSDFSPEDAQNYLSTLETSCSETAAAKCDDKFMDKLVFKIALLDTRLEKIRVLATEVEFLLVSMV